MPFNQKLDNLSKIKMINYSVQKPLYSLLQATSLTSTEH